MWDSILLNDEKSEQTAKESTYKGKNSENTLSEKKQVTQ